MTDEEIKNRISLVLKDSILQQGFEYICKENAELKEKLLQEREDYWSKGFNYSKCKLTKAKEIIKRLMDIINHDLKCFDTMAGLDIKQKAEQFLKEE